MSRRIVLPALAAVLLLFQPPVARAIDVTPSIGAMIPSNTLFISSGTYLRMQTHTMYGLSLGTSLSDAIGLELAAAAGTGKMEAVGGTALQIASTAFLADLRSRLRIAGGDDGNLGVVLGVGYTDFKLGLFDFAKESGQGDFFGRLTGVGGLDVRANLSDHVHLTVSMLDRIHAQGVSLTGLTATKKDTQHDIHVMAGLRFPLD